MLNHPTYEATYAYLTQYSYDGAMDRPTFYAARGAAPQRGDIPTCDRLAQLAYYLNDKQREALQQLAAVNRLNDAATAAQLVSATRSRWICPSGSLAGARLTAYAAISRPMHSTS
jgi:hypothetical protein